MSGASARSRTVGAMVGTGVALAAAYGCSSGPVPEAFKNKVFYTADAVGVDAGPRVEQRYPPLDLGAQAALPDYLGVSIFAGAVHLSRPTNWVIRSASTTAEHRYVEYVSPSEYMVSIYELVDSPVDPWREIIGRYEDQAEKDGADLLGKRIPIAAGNTQGRGYVVRRPVAAAKVPFVNYANEYLLRSEHRVLLVQIVHHDEKLDQLGTELRRTIETFEAY